MKTQSILYYFKLLKEMRTVFLLILCVLTCSCESEIDPPTTDIQPKLVVNSLLTFGSDTSQIYVTDSRSVFRKDEGYIGEDPFKNIKNAIVKFTVNNTTEILSYSIKDSAYLYTKRLKADDQIKIEVSDAERHVIASANIPQAPTVLSIDTVSFEKIKDGYLYKYLRFSVRIKDLPLRKNYYRLVLDVAAHYTSEWSDWNYWSYSTQFYSEDPVLSNGNPSNIEDPNIEIVRFSRNYLGIFNDALINGKEYTLSFYINYPEVLKNSLNKGRVNVKLQSITEDLYRYYGSLQKYEDVNLDVDVAEPVVVFSNIQNGIGILGASNDVQILKVERK